MADPWNHVEDPMPKHDDRRELDRIRRRPDPLDDPTRHRFDNPAAKGAKNKGPKANGPMPRRRGGTA